MQRFQERVQRRLVRAAVQVAQDGQRQAHLRSVRRWAVIQCEGGNGWLLALRNILEALEHQVQNTGRRCCLVDDQGRIAVFQACLDKVIVLTGIGLGQRQDIADAPRLQAAQREVLPLLPGRRRRR